jgi:hypothetical protein
MGYEMASIKEKPALILAAGRRSLTSSSAHHGLGEDYHKNISRKELNTVPVNKAELGSCLSCLLFYYCMCVFIAPKAAEFRMTEMIDLRFILHPFMA